jgi:hypothetical protein
VSGFMAVLVAEGAVRAAVIRSIPGIAGSPARPADANCWDPEAGGRFAKGSCPGDTFMTIPLPVRADSAAIVSRTVTWTARGASGSLICAKPVGYFRNGGVHSAPAEKCNTGTLSTSVNVPAQGNLALSVRSNPNGMVVPISANGIWSVSYPE